MKKKYQYGKNTAHYKMASYGKGDVLSPELEFAKLQAIENQLLAGTKGIKCCVFEDGNYHLIKDTSDEYNIKLTGTGRKKAACGIVNGIYFEENSKLSWEGLKSGYVHYLYICPTINLFENKKAYRTFSSHVERDLLKTTCLLATVDLRDGKEEIDTNPEGKITSMDIVSHTYGKENPHGENLLQDSITISKNLNFDIDKNKSINDSIITINDKRDLKVPVIETNGEIILKDKRSKVQLSESDQTSLKTESKSIIGAINELASKEISLESCKTKVINFNTFSSGVKLEIEEGEVVFVQVHQRFTGRVKSIESVAIGYHEDGIVENENEFIVHVESSEEEEIAMKAIVYYR